MDSASLEYFKTSLNDAALEPDLWPATLKSLMDAADAIGAALIVRNNRTGAIDWATLLGPSADCRSDFIDYFSKLYPYSPVLERSPRRSLLRLSERVPVADLRKSEWYNDFVLKCGVGDIVGTRLYDDSSHTILLGIHERIGRAPLTRERAARVQQLLEHIDQAARFQHLLHEHRRKSLVALTSLDQFSAGVIVSDADGHVVEINGIAEHVIRRGDGLTLRQGKLGAVRVFEAAKLTALVTAASTKTGGSIGRMLVGKTGGGRPYILTITPLRPHLNAHDRPLVLTLIIDTERRLPSKEDIAELFGLSSAESRLAVALMSGKRLQEIATSTRVAVATLRTQLSSILRKVGVDRQTDLVQMLSNIPVGQVRAEEAVDAERYGPNLPAGWKGAENRRDD